MFGFIKKLFSGILSFLIGLFRGKNSQENQSNPKPSELVGKPAELLGKVTGKTKRRSGYFLELDENEEKGSVDANKSPASNGAKTAEAATKPAKAESAKKTETAANTQPAKAESAKKTETTANTQSANIELVQTAEGVKVEPGKPAKSPVASTNGQAKTETTFAPKYLIPSASSNGRRRPGPNMNTFLDMARQVKTPG
jgi:hypothetical protein